MGEVFQGTIGLRQAYWQSPFEAIGLLFVLFDTVAIMLENCGHLDLTVEGHFNPGLVNPKLQPQTFQPQTFPP